MINTFILNIKRAETPTYAFIKNMLKSILKFNMPSIKWVHRPLYSLHILITRGIPELYSKLWVVPIFKSYCKKCGSSLRIYNGMPYVQGNPHIYVGDNVTFNSCTIASGHVYDTPMLTIGNRSTIGYANTISCAKSITIGDDVLIAANCFIADNNGHPLDPEKRAQHMAVDKSEVAPIVIGNNVWIGSNCVILKGVTIGDNCIIASNTVVSKSVPANTIVKTGENSLIKNYQRFILK